MNELTDWVKEKGVLAAVVVLSLAVFAGQIVEAGAFSLENLPDAVRAVVDPVQYMVGMMIVGFIFILTVIKKYESLPNPFLVTLKWYFAILFLNHFLVLVLRIIQKSNILSFTNAFSSVGKLYLIFASVRSITDLTITSAATYILVRGLVRYKFIDGDSTQNTTGRTILLLILFKWIVSIPVNMTGLLTNQTLFVWSLGLSQVSGLAIMALIYRIVREHRQHYGIKFFDNLDWYFGITLFIMGLNFVYNIGTYGLIQRFPAGEIGMLGGFGKIVLYMSFLSQVARNYLMYNAINGYDEGAAVIKKEMAAMETPDVTLAGE